MSKEEVFYTFDDITLIPQYSELRSRKVADTSVEFYKYKLKTPIISANMEAITGSDMAIAMWKAGGIGALHRFWTPITNLNEYYKICMNDCDCLVSVGVGEESKERTQKLYLAGARMFIIDIAHGHSILMKEMIQWMRKQYKDNIFIVAGNVATPKAIKDLVKWGADIIKCGVSPGSVCSTRIVTGHGLPAFTSLQRCAEEADRYNIKLISDGGIKSSGDIIKSFVAGADYVMLGSLLSGTNETPGEVIIENGKLRKKYFGSASYNREGTTKEGVEVYVDLKGPVENIINNLTGGIRSGMSYSNAKTLKELYYKAKYVIQTHNGFIEGTPHILK